MSHECILALIPVLLDHVHVPDETLPNGLNKVEVSTSRYKSRGIVKIIPAAQRRPTPDAPIGDI